MAFGLAQRLQRVGVAGPLAREMSAQINSGSVNINRLLSSGMPVGLASRFTAGITAGTVDVDKLTAMSMSPVVAGIVGKQINAIPVNTVLPAITGTAQVGQTLTTTNGTWTSKSAATYARQWLADGVNIAGATATTYVPVTDDVGKTITVVVTATNANGSATATSAATAEVIAA